MNTRRKDSREEKKRTILLFGLYAHDAVRKGVRIYIEVKVFEGRLKSDVPPFCHKTVFLGGGSFEGSKNNGGLGRPKKS